MKANTPIEARTTTNPQIITTTDPDDPEIRYVWTLSGIAMPSDGKYPPPIPSTGETTYYTPATKEQTK